MDSGLQSAYVGYGAQLAAAGADMAMQYSAQKWNEKEAKKVRDWNKEMYQMQLEDNRENWRLMNEYNLPSAQLARLRDANLSPLLMYSNGASGMVAADTAKGANVNSAPLAHHNLDTNFAQALKGMQLIDAQIRNIDADTEQKQSVSRGNNIMSDINEATKDVQIAMKYGQNDLVNQSIRNMSAALINEGMITAEQCATLAQGRIYQIKHFDLSETQVGNEYKIGLGQVANGRIQANAATQQAAAAMKNAIANANLSDAQVGLLVKQAANWQLQNDYLEKTLGSRVFQATQASKEQYWRAVNASWAPLLNEVGISKTQSEIFLNSLKGDFLKIQSNQLEQNMLLEPAGLLLDYSKIK